MVFPVLFTPSTLIGSLSLVLVPELSEDYYRKNYERLKKNLLRGLRFAFFIACVLIPFFYALGEDIGRLAFSNQTAGEMIKKSCLILLPMSLTMISTAMLNSLGFEKQTFVFYFVGAAALLLSVLFLPKFCGAYAYVVGLGISYLLTAACNLALLYKKCPFLKKERGQVRDYSPIFALLSVLPLSLLGQFCSTLFKNFAGETLCAVFTALVLALTTAFVYLALRILPLSKKKSSPFL
ncbi:MAG: polysaccharide biosynthesis C-terminal domain-containing protein, partial [Clostridia bacterium]|nr:polysaccharide biosynthesis C-terminal domain-containing protein [Clostridia bacterium]